MNKKGKLCRRDYRILRPYLAHLEAMKRDIQDVNDVRDELEWLAENGYVSEVKKDVYRRTKKGKTLNRIMDAIEKGNAHD